MHIEEIVMQISDIDLNVRDKAQKRFDNLIKPVGSLAKLEEMVSRYAGITGRYKKGELTYPKKGVLIWADMDKAKEAEKIMHGMWPINVFAQEIASKLETLLITASCKEEALEEGASLVKEYITKDQFEMVGYGCLSDADNEIILYAMAGGILQAAALKVPVMLDSLATCKALLIAMQYCSKVNAYCFAGHISLEEGCSEALDKAGLSAPLKLEISRGCGEGAVLAFTLFDAGVKAYNEMETFEEAGVHVEVKEFSHAEQIKEEQAEL